MDRWGSRDGAFLAGSAGSPPRRRSGRRHAARRGQPERPNILWFISEDNNPYIGAYGDPVARTPTIDRLGARGDPLRDRVLGRAGLRAVALRADHRHVRRELRPRAPHARERQASRPACAASRSTCARPATTATNNAKTDYNAPIDLAATWDASSAPGALARTGRRARRSSPSSRRCMTHESQLFGTTAARPRGPRTCASRRSCPTRRRSARTARAPTTTWRRWTRSSPRAWRSSRRTASPRTRSSSTSATTAARSRAASGSPTTTGCTSR